jgi:predicted  nucleic acid-binding Zn-ribbon protein
MTHKSKASGTRKAPPWFSIGIKALSDQIASLEKSFASMEGSLTDQIASLEKSFTAMERSLTDQIASLEKSFTAMERSLTELKHEIRSYERHTKRRLDDLDDNITSLRRVVHRHGVEPAVDERIEPAARYAYNGGIRGFRFEL